MSDIPLARLLLDYGGAEVVRKSTRHLVRCACGGYRWDTSQPHSPRWVDGRVVDCQGSGVER